MVLQRQLHYPSPSSSNCSTSLALRLHFEHPSHSSSYNQKSAGMVDWGVGSNALSSATTVFHHHRQNFFTKFQHPAINRNSRLKGEFCALHPWHFTITSRTYIFIFLHALSLSDIADWWVMSLLSRSLLHHQFHHHFQHFSRYIQHHLTQTPSTMLQCGSMGGVFSLHPWYNHHYLQHHSLNTSITVLYLPQTLSCWLV